MDCPVCQNIKLVMSDRQGIEIDYCPNCRGVWLDRGELDKLIDRSAGIGTSPPQPARNEPQHGQAYQPQGFGHAQQTHGYPQHQHDYYKKKKKSGFLGELFDFD